MNKYIIKLAEKYELEPGVYWDTQTHTMKPGTKFMSEEMRKADRGSRLVTGGIGGLMYGAPIGGIMGHANYGTLGAVGGATLGIAALGGLGYLLGGLRPVDKPRVRDKIITRLETKHDNRIHEIEGWDKL